MVIICGKCKHFIKTETTNDGYFYHYCNKADELFSFCRFGLWGETSEVPTLKVKFNDTVCQYYEKRRQ